MNQQYGRPIAVFWYNLHMQGAEFSVSDDGQLKAKLPDILKQNQYVKDEIIKRKDLLIKLLDKRNLDPLLAQYIGDPMTEDEASYAPLIARRRGYDIDIYQIGDEYIAGNARRSTEQQIRAAVDNYGQRNGIDNLDKVLEIMI